MSFHGAAFARDQERCRAEAQKLLASSGSKHGPPLLAASLPYGEQRMLELARAPCGPSPRLLMLDEPAAGLNAAEVDRLLETDSSSSQGRHDHHCRRAQHGFVMQIADRVLVMDYGQQLFEGPPAEAQRKRSGDCCLSRSVT